MLGDVRTHLRAVGDRVVRVLLEEAEAELENAFIGLTRTAPEADATPNDKGEPEPPAAADEPEQEDDE